MVLVWGETERKGTSMSIAFASVAFPRLIIDVLLALVIALWLLLIGTGIFALRKRFHTARVKAARQLEREREDRRSNLLCLFDQLKELRLALCGVSEWERKFWLHISPPEPLPQFQLLYVELESLVKALEHVEQMLSSGIMLYKEHIDGFIAWFDELKALYEDRQQETLFFSSIVEVWKHEAIRQWQDLIGFSMLSSKDFLLQTLQGCMVAEAFHSAAARRKLTEGSDAASEHRKALINWAASEALRCVLQTKRTGESLSPQEVTRQHFRTFVFALLDRTDNLIALLQEENAEKRTTPSSALLTV
jgi:hypothetical protein